MRIFKIVFLFLFCVQQIGLCQNDLASDSGNTLNWKEIASFSKANIPFENLNGSFFCVHNEAILIAGGNRKLAKDSLQGAGFQWNNKVIVLVENETGSYEKVEKEFTFPHVHLQLPLPFRQIMVWFVSETLLRKRRKLRHL